MQNLAERLQLSDSCELYQESCHLSQVCRYTSTARSHIILWLTALEVSKAR